MDEEQDSYHYQHSSSTESAFESLALEDGESERTGGAVLYNTSANADASSVQATKKGDAQEFSNVNYATWKSVGEVHDDSSSTRSANESLDLNDGDSEHPVVGVNLHSTSANANSFAVQVTKTGDGKEFCDLSTAAWKSVAAPEVSERFVLPGSLEPQFGSPYDRPLPPFSTIGYEGFSLSQAQPASNASLFHSTLGDQNNQAVPVGFSTPQATATVQQPASAVQPTFGNVHQATQHMGFGTPVSKSTPTSQTTFDCGSTRPVKTTFDTATISRAGFSLGICTPATIGSAVPAQTLNFGFDGSASTVPERVPPAARKMKKSATRKKRGTPQTSAGICSPATTASANPVQPFDIGLGSNRPAISKCVLPAARKTKKTAAREKVGTPQPITEGQPTLHFERANILPVVQSMPGTSHQATQPLGAQPGTAVAWPTLTNSSPLPQSKPAAPTTSGYDFYNLITPTTPKAITTPAGPGLPATTTSALPGSTLTFGVGSNAPSTPSPAASSHSGTSGFNLGAAQLTPISTGPTYSNASATSTPSLSFGTGFASGLGLPATTNSATPTSTSTFGVVSNAPSTPSVAATSHSGTSGFNWSAAQFIPISTGVIRSDPSAASIPSCSYGTGSPRLVFPQAQPGAFVPSTSFILAAPPNVSVIGLSLGNENAQATPIGFGTPQARTIVQLNLNYDFQGTTFQPAVQPTLGTGSQATHQLGLNLPQGTEGGTLSYSTPLQQSIPAAPTTAVYYLIPKATTTPAAFTFLQAQPVTSVPSTNFIKTERPNVSVIDLTSGDEGEQATPIVCGTSQGRTGVQRTLKYSSQQTKFQAAEPPTLGPTHPLGCNDPLGAQPGTAGAFLSYSTPRTQSEPAAPTSSGYEINFPITETTANATTTPAGFSSCPSLPGTTASTTPASTLTFRVGSNAPSTPSQTATSHSGTSRFNLGAAPFTPISDASATSTPSLSFDTGITFPQAHPVTSVPSTNFIKAERPNVSVIDLTSGDEGEQATPIVCGTSQGRTGVQRTLKYSSQQTKFQAAEQPTLGTGHQPTQPLGCKDPVGAQPGNTEAILSYSTPRTQSELSAPTTSGHDINFPITNTTPKATTTPAGFSSGLGLPPITSSAKPASTLIFGVGSNAPSAPSRAATSQSGTSRFNLGATPFPPISTGLTISEASPTSTPLLSFGTESSGFTFPQAQPVSSLPSTNFIKAEPPNVSVIDLTSGDEDEQATPNMFDTPQARTGVQPTLKYSSQQTKFQAAEPPTLGTGRHPTHPLGCKDPVGAQPGNTEAILSYSTPRTQSELSAPTTSGHDINFPKTKTTPKATTTPAGFSSCPSLPGTTASTTPASTLTFRVGSNAPSTPSQTATSHSGTSRFNLGAAPFTPISDASATSTPSLSFDTVFSSGLSLPGTTASTKPASILTFGLGSNAPCTPSRAATSHSGTSRFNLGAAQVTPISTGVIFSGTSATSTPSYSFGTKSPGFTLPQAQPVSSVPSTNFTKAEPPNISVIDLTLGGEEERGTPIVFGTPLARTGVQPTLTYSSKQTEFQAAEPQTLGTGHQPTHPHGCKDHLGTQPGTAGASLSYSAPRTQSELSAPTSCGYENNFPITVTTAKSTATPAGFSSGLGLPATSPSATPTSTLIFGVGSNAPSTPSSAATSDSGTSRFNLGASPFTLISTGLMVSDASATSTPSLSFDTGFSSSPSLPGTIASTTPASTLTFRVGSNEPSTPSQTATSHSGTSRFNLGAAPLTPISTGLMLSDTSAASTPSLSFDTGFSSGLSLPTTTAPATPASTLTFGISSDAPSTPSQTATSHSGTSRFNLGAAPFTPISTGLMLSDASVTSTPSLSLDTGFSSCPSLPGTTASTTLASTSTFRVGSNAPSTPSQTVTSKSGTSRFNLGAAPFAPISTGLKFADASPASTPSFSFVTESPGFALHHAQPGTFVTSTSSIAAAPPNVPVIDLKLGDENVQATPIGFGTPQARTSFKPTLKYYSQQTKSPPPVQTTLDTGYQLTHLLGVSKALGTQPGTAGPTWSYSTPLPQSEPAPTTSGYDINFPVTATTPKATTTAAGFSSGRNLSATTASATPTSTSTCGVSSSALSTPSPAATSDPGFTLGAAPRTTLSTGSMFSTTTATIPPSLSFVTGNVHRCEDESQALYDRDWVRRIDGVNAHCTSTNADSSAIQAAQKEESQESRNVGTASGTPVGDVHNYSSSTESADESLALNDGDPERPFDGVNLHSTSANADSSAILATKTGDGHEFGDVSTVTGKSVGKAHDDFSLTKSADESLASNYGDSERPFDGVNLHSTSANADSSAILATKTGDGHEFGDVSTATGKTVELSYGLGKAHDDFSLTKSADESLASNYGDSERPFDGVNLHSTSANADSSAILATKTGDGHEFGDVSSVTGKSVELSYGLGKAHDDFSLTKSADESLASNYGDSERPFDGVNLHSTSANADSSAILATKTGDGHEFGDVSTATGKTVASPEDSRRTKRTVRRIARSCIARGRSACGRVARHSHIARHGRHLSVGGSTWTVETQSAPINKASDFIADPESVAMLSSMGFLEAQAVKALKATNNNLERAGDWICSHAAELDQEDQPMETTASNTYEESFRNGNPDLAFSSQGDPHDNTSNKGFLPSPQENMDTEGKVHNDTSSSKSTDGYQARDDGDLERPIDDISAHSLSINAVSCAIQAAQKEDSQKSRDFGIATVKSVEASDFIADPESVAMLSSMGFLEAQAVKALKATNNNLERAGDWICSHAAELDQEDQPMETTASNTYEESFRNGNPDLAFSSQGDPHDNTSNKGFLPSPQENMDTEDLAFSSQGDPHDNTSNKGSLPSPQENMDTEGKVHNDTSSSKSTDGYQARDDGDLERPIDDISAHSLSINAVSCAIQAAQKEDSQKSRDFGIATVKSVGKVHSDFSSTKCAYDSQRDGDLECSWVEDELDYEYDEELDSPHYKPSSWTETAKESLAQDDGDPERPVNDVNTHNLSINAVSAVIQTAQKEESRETHDVGTATGKSVADPESKTPTKTVKCVFSSLHHDPLESSTNETSVSIEDDDAFPLFTGIPNETPRSILRVKEKEHGSYNKAIYNSLSLLNDIPSFSELRSCVKEVFENVCVDEFFEGNCRLEDCKKIHDKLPEISDCVSIGMTVWNATMYVICHSSRPNIEVLKSLVRYFSWNFQPSKVLILAKCIHKLRNADTVEFTRYLVKHLTNLFGSKDAVKWVLFISYSHLEGDIFNVLLDSLDVFKEDLTFCLDLLHFLNFRDHILPLKILVKLIEDVTNRSPTHDSLVDTIKDFLGRLPETETAQQDSVVSHFMSQFNICSLEELKKLKPAKTVGGSPVSLTHPPAPLSHFPLTPKKRVQFRMHDDIAIPGLERCQNTEIPDDTMMADDGPLDNETEVHHETPLYDPYTEKCVSCVQAVFGNLCMGWVLIGECEKPKCSALHALGEDWLSSTSTENLSLAIDFFTLQSTRPNMAILEAFINFLCVRKDADSNKQDVCTLLLFRKVAPKLSTVDSVKLTRLVLTQLSKFLPRQSAINTLLFPNNLDLGNRYTDSFMFDSDMLKTIMTYMVDGQLEATDIFVMPWVVNEIMRRVSLLTIQERDNIQHITNIFIQKCIIDQELHMPDHDLFKNPPIYFDNTYFSKFEAQLQKGVTNNYFVVCLMVKFIIEREEQEKKREKSKQENLKIEEPKKAESKSGSEGVSEKPEEQKPKQSNPNTTVVAKEKAINILYSFLIFQFSRARILNDLLENCVYFKKPLSNIILNFLSGIGLCVILRFMEDGHLAEALEIFQVLVRFRLNLFELEHGLIDVSDSRLSWILCTLTAESDDHLSAIDIFLNHYFESFINIDITSSLEREMNELMEKLFCKFNSKLLWSWSHTLFNGIFSKQKNLMIPLNILKVYESTLRTTLAFPCKPTAIEACLKLFLQTEDAGVHQNLQKSTYRSLLLTGLEKVNVSFRKINDTVLPNIFVPLIRKLLAAGIAANAYFQFEKTGNRIRVYSSMTEDELKVYLEWRFYFLVRASARVGVNHFSNMNVEIIPDCITDSCLLPIHFKLRNIDNSLNSCGDRLLKVVSHLSTAPVTSAVFRKIDDSKYQLTSDAVRDLCQVVVNCLLFHRTDDSLIQQLPSVCFRHEKRYHFV